MNRRSLFFVASVALALVTFGCWLPVLATPAPTLQPTITSVSPPTAVPTLGPSPSGTVRVFLIKLEDQGQAGTPVGCGDSLVALDTAVPAGDNPLVSAYAALFAIQDERIGSQGYYNALHASDLVVDSVSVDEQGTATVRLAGEYSLGGACDTPRFQAQLEAAALQFPQVSSVNILLNDLPLEQVLSGQ